MWNSLLPSVFFLQLFLQKTETEGIEGKEVKNETMEARTNAIDQKVENSSEILPVFSNVTVTYPHYDIERIQEQRHKQFQYVCDKYKDEIPPNVSQNHILFKSCTLWQI